MQGPPNRLAGCRAALGNPILCRLSDLTISFFELQEYREKVFMIRNLSIALIRSSFFCLLCFGFAEANSSSQSNDGAVLVEIDGTRISAAEFNRKKPGALFQAQMHLYDTQRKALDAFVDEYLLERQAKKENVTVTELLKRHVESGIEKDPSEEVLGLLRGRGQQRAVRNSNT